LKPQFSPIIVAGMHRSGTSFTASLLSALAVDMGQHLLPQDVNNRRGYFEDVEFLELQRKILSECCAPDDGGHPDWGWTESESLEQEGFKRFLPEAQALIASRAEHAAYWGWKDPRTTLLLDFWDELLVDARYVLVYRFPWEVADSMQRLGAEVFLRNPEYAYRTWLFYNRHLRDFYRKHPERCLLVSSNALPKKLGEFKHLLRDKLGLEVNEAELEDIYEGDLLHSITGVDPLIDLVAAIWPDCTQLLSELDELADLSGAELWQARPVRSRLARPDTATREGSAVDVSVVIPCYNQGTLLIEAIASAERFAPTNCELIIVNDGSQQTKTLEVLEILRRCGYFIVDQQNQGLSAARNAGIALARGRYLLPLDDDNRIRANFIEDAIRVLDSSPRVGVVYGDRYDFGLRRGEQPILEFDLALILKENYIDACAIFRQRVWSDCHGYDPAVSPLEDWDLWLSAAERGWEFHRLPYVTFDYRVRPDSLLTRVNPVEIKEDHRRKIRIKHWELYRKDSIEHLERVRRLQAEQAGRQNRSDLDLMREQIAEKEQTIQMLMSDAARKEEEVKSLKAQLALREAEIARIKGTLGWRPPDATATGVSERRPVEPHQARVDIIICSHSPLATVKKCLRSLIQCTRMPYSFILVDDGGDEEARKHLVDFALTQGAMLLRNEEATGFALAADKGLRQSSAAYVVILSSNVEVTPGWLERMVACAESDQRIGLVGPISNYDVQQQNPLVFGDDGLRLNGLPEGARPDDIAKVLGETSRRLYTRLPFVNGFCVMLKRGVINEVGYFDVSNFGESLTGDMDYRLCAAKAGWQIALADDVYVHHIWS
jgi:GT2 family glycosyltransferase